MKNKLYRIIIVLCLVGAAVIFIRSRSQRGAGVESLKPGESIWVKCNNPECGAVYQRDKKDYFKQVEEKKRTNPALAMLPTAPPITCRECGKESAIRAVKCEKCGHVFFYGAHKGKKFDFSDRCPKCSFSKIEEGRRTARESQ